MSVSGLATRAARLTKTAIPDRPDLPVDDGGDPFVGRQQVAQAEVAEHDGGRQRAAPPFDLVERPDHRFRRQPAWMAIAEPPVERLAITHGGCPSYSRFGRAGGDGQAAEAFLSVRTKPTPVMCDLFERLVGSSGGQNTL
jgi:hypothetical protein